MKRTTIFLTEKQVEKIEKIEQESGLKFSEIVRRAIDMFLESKEEK